MFNVKSYLNIFITDCRIYSLDSVNIIRKYVKFIDRLFNNTSDFKCIISKTEQYCVTVNNSFYYPLQRLLKLYLSFFPESNEGTLFSVHMVQKIIYEIF